MFQRLVNHGLMAVFCKEFGPYSTQGPLHDAVGVLRGRYTGTPDKPRFSVIKTRRLWMFGYFARCNGRHYRTRTIESLISSPWKTLGRSSRQPLRYTWTHMAKTTQTHLHIVWRRTEDNWLVEETATLQRGACN